MQYKKKAAAAVVAEAKEEAREEIASAKDALTFKEELLNQDVAMGRITIAQKLAAEKDLVTQREMLEHQALAQEQLTEGISINKWQELENKKLDITRKADLERQKLQNQGELQDQQIWQGMLDKMTQGWDRGIQAMLHGQMTLSQGFTGALKQMENQTEMSFINMGLNWLKAAALQALIGKESHASQTLLDAKGAAAGAYNATVGIPFVGPVLAPAAAAVAFTGVMAFAEGGWDRVPSDQVAMIHKNEMVLPASIAEPVRQMAAAGAGGGGGQPLHIHAVDAPSVLALFRRHQGSLMSVMGEAMRNGRKS